MMMILQDGGIIMMDENGDMVFDKLPEGIKTPAMRKAVKRQNLENSQQREIFGNLIRELSNEDLAVALIKAETFYPDFQPRIEEEIVERLYPDWMNSDKILAAYERVTDELHRRLNLNKGL